MEPVFGSHEYVSGGYFIARPGKRPERKNELLPEWILTASHCLVDLVLDTWAVEWSSDSRESRLEAASRLGLDGAALAELTAWCTRALDTGELGWPGVFFDVEVARRVRARFLPQDDLVVFGIALPRDLTQEFLEELSPKEATGDTGVAAAIRRGAPPNDGGTALGFDILGWDWSYFHSYACNSLESEFASALGITPNRHGFFDRLEDARRCADHCNLETTGAEPVFWLPWLVHVYDGLGTSA